MADNEKTTSTDAPDEAPTIAATLLTDYFFPTYGVTISAHSREEAERKLAATIKK
jgi:hypothetical protein